MSSEAGVCWLARDHRDPASSLQHRASHLAAPVIVELEVRRVNALLSGRLAYAREHGDRDDVKFVVSLNLQPYGRIALMRSKLAEESRRALQQANARLTAEQRLDAFLRHSKAMAELKAAGQRIRRGRRGPQP